MSSQIILAKIKTKLINYFDNPILAAALILTFLRFIYSGWYFPLLHMIGDGIRGIFSGVDGFFLPGPLRLKAGGYFNHPYLSILFFYSIFHPLCSTAYLGAVLIALAHISVICVILLSARLFEVPQGKKIFVLLLVVLIFNWAPFYDGVLQGFPAEFPEVLGITLGFSLLLSGHAILAGAAFGFASLLKILPVVFLPYFLYKKQYRLVLSAVVFCAIFTVIILFKENISWNLLTAVIKYMQDNGSYWHNARDAGLNAFIYFIFRGSLSPFALKGLYLTSCLLLALFFILIERLILSQKHKYLFAFAAISLFMFQVSPHCSEMYWYILLLPTLVFNIWLLIFYRDRLFTLLFGISYIFLHGFSLLNIFFRIFRLIDKGKTLPSDIYLFFNEHGGVFVGVWLLYFSTYGLALKYLAVNKKDE